MPSADQAAPLTPDEIAGHSFSTHFRGYDTTEVKTYLRQVADAHRELLRRVEKAEATEAKAAELVSTAEVRAAELLREAQDEARRIVEAVAGERERAFSEGAARAEAVVADAQSERKRIEEDARHEAARMVAEGKAARTRVLDDLRRRRKSARAQVEQLYAARERLLAHLNEVRNAIDATTRGLRDAMPEVKSAADAAARRVSVEEDASIEQLESEIDALKLAGLSLLPPVTDAEQEGAEPAAAGPADAAPSAAEGAVDAHEDAGTEGAERTSGPTDAAVAEPAAADEDAEATSVDRRSSSVRIVRPMRSQDPETGLPEEELVPIDPPDPDEAVRIVGAGELHDVTLDEAPPALDEVPPAPPAPVTPSWPQPHDEPPAEEGGAAEEPAADTEPAATAPEARPSQEAVGALFARLKAGRDETEPETEPAAEPTAATAETVETTETEPPEEPEEPEAAEEEPANAARAELLARRDTTLAPATKALNRHLKRLLADEQNELLDALRRAGTEAGVPDAAEHDATWAAAATSELALAAAAGGAFLGGGGAQPSPDDLVAVAEALADAVAGPLRERLAQVLADADDDADVAGDGVRAVYRTWRSERLGPAIDDAVHDAFCLGLSVALGPGTAVSWLVDDGGHPCPDCDDDALAGALPCGEAFPTGHRRPPAHPGCRCVLVVPDDAALAPG